MPPYDYKLPSELGTIAVPLPSGATALFREGEAIKQRNPAEVFEMLGVSNGQVTKSTDFTFALADLGKMHRTTKATAQQGTIPPQASVEWPANAMIQIVVRGDGQLEIVAGAGVTLHSLGDLTKSAGKNAMLSLWRESENVWVLGGALSA